MFLRPVQPTAVSLYQGREQLLLSLGEAGQITMESLLLLPGVVDERRSKGVNATDDWPLIERTLAGAIEHLTQMRSNEGRAMADDLRANCQAIAEQLYLQWSEERQSPVP